MYNLCLLVACIVCAGDGRRLKATLDQNFRSPDVKGQDNRSGSWQFAANGANPRRVLAVLLTFFSPAIVLAPDLNDVGFNSSAIEAAETGLRFHPQKPILSNPIGAKAGLRSLADQNYAETQEFWGPVVRIVVGVDWEGTHLQETNFQFFKDFREAHPEVPLTHFLNAAYFTKSEGQSTHEWSPHQALSPIDGYGLLINGLKSVVESAGVEYRSEPNILQSPEQLEKASAEGKELRADYGPGFSESQWMGYDADIRAYSVDELQKIVSKAKVILEKEGLKVGKYFRVGAWLAGPNVLEAFRREGFRVDASAVGFDEMVGKLPSADVEFWRDTPLSAILNEIWPGITKDSQPFLKETPVGIVLEMPDTGGSVEHATAKDIVDHINGAVQQLDSEDRFVHIGFIQETAAEFGPRLVAAITEIKRKHGPRVVFETLKASAQRAMTTQRMKELQANMYVQST